MSGRDAEVSKAKLAEQAERYDDMASHMKAVRAARQRGGFTAA